jgi:hypothetical protein
MPATINGTSGFGGNLTGNVTGNADTATTAGKFSTTSGDAPIYGCRAWVNFDGTKDTTGAASTSNTNRLIRASGNVTSVLRNGLGDYTITFTTAMPDADYSVAGMCKPVIAGEATDVYYWATNPTASAFRIVTSAGAAATATAYDSDRVTLQIVR